MNSKFSLFVILGLLAREEKSSSENELCFRKLGRGPQGSLFWGQKTLVALMCQMEAVGWGQGHRKWQSFLRYRDSYLLFHPAIRRDKENPESVPWFWTESYTDKTPALCLKNSDNTNTNNKFRKLFEQLLPVFQELSRTFNLASATTSSPTPYFIRQQTKLLLSLFYR